MKEVKHIPVLLNETIALLKPNYEVLIDLTLGSGGHSLEMLRSSKSSNVERLIGIDVDNKNIENFKERLIVEFKLERDNLREATHGTSILMIGNIEVILVNDNFSNISEILNSLNIKKVDFMLADLGWSMDQLSSIPGLSFDREEEELDMRLGKELGVKASDLLNMLVPSNIEKMFSEYADFRRHEARSLANEIVKFRKTRPFIYVKDLNKVLSNADSRALIKTKARVYQSLRIAVNNEYINLKNLIKAGFEYLEESGRFSIITFHSGEEKIVEKSFKEFEEDRIGRFVQNKSKLYFQPTVEELFKNISSRSAKLWTIDKN